MHFCHNESKARICRTVYTTLMWSPTPAYTVPLETACPGIGNTSIHILMFAIRTLSEADTILFCTV